MSDRHLKCYAELKNKIWLPHHQTHAVLRGYLYTKILPHIVTLPSTSRPHLFFHLTPSPFPPPHTLTLPSTSHPHPSLHLTPLPFPSFHTLTLPSTSHPHLSLHLTPSPFSPRYTIHTSIISLSNQMIIACNNKCDYARHCPMYNYMYVSLLLVHMYA